MFIVAKIRKTTYFFSDTTYRVTVMISNVSTLSGLALSAGILSPTFSSETTSYASSVTNATTPITVTPTVTDASATIKVNRTTVASGTASQSIPLVAGTNKITTVVTAQDGKTTSTYTTTVTRQSLDFTYSSALDVPVTSAGYIATGNVANLLLSFAPPTGTDLTVVNNTGIGFITGRFNNLAQGQTVPLTYNNITYQYVVNYYGGTGNDLVLQWPHVRAYAWGNNGSGQLGNGGDVSSAIPDVVSSTGILAGKSVASMATGTAHSLVLCMDGTVAAWGGNSAGQLGNNTTISENVPVAVSTSGVLSGKTVITLAAGASHSLALCSDGTVLAWGDNSNGQLGNNATAYSSVPVAVLTTGVLSGKTVVAIAAGAFHSLALCSDGTVAGWGYNADGELGNNTMENSSVPVSVSIAGVLAGKTVKAIATGYYHCLALCSDGAVAAWGYNGSGQLGNNTATSSSVPVMVSATGVLNGKTVASIATGGSHSLALCSDGTLCSWGDNVYSQLGIGSNIGSRWPVAVYAGGALYGKTVSQIRAGYGHSLALCADGTLASWGYNQDGELGNSSTTNRQVPTTVPLSPLGIGTRLLALAQSSTANHALASVAIPLSDNSVLMSLALSEGSLSPAFAASTSNYTASVPGSTESLTLTPVTVNAYATVKVNGTAVAPGSTSQAIPLAAGDNTVNVVVTAENGLGTTTYAITVFRPSWISTLSALALSEGMLSPMFAAGTTAYAASVSNATTSVTVTPSAADANATVKVNGVTVSSGTASASIPLVVGDNPISVVATAQDGISLTTYTVTVTRVSTVSTLSGLALSAGSLSPAFATGITAYTASVTASVMSVTPTVTDSNATVTVNGVSVATGTAGAPIQLVVGTNPITVLVTAQDGTTQSTYTVTVTRLSTVSTLAGLAISTGSLSPAFATGTTAYMAILPATATGVAVTPTASDLTSTIKVNGTSVTSGATSAVIPITDTQAIATVVTAQDGSTTTYTFTVAVSGYAAWNARAFTTPADLADPAVSGDLATPAHDGISNLMKYALALPPMTCGTADLPTVSKQDGYLALTYRKSKTATDVTYTVQASDSLDGNAWAPATTVLSQTDGGNCWLVTVRDSVPYAGQARRFMRMWVEK